jgi:hypothetical protein
VAHFGPDFYSVVFHELLAEGSIARSFADHKIGLNAAGLFGSAEAAERFLAQYQAQPEREPGSFFIHEIRGRPMRNALQRGLK